MLSSARPRPPTPTPIHAIRANHADGDTVLFEYASECLAVELAALVAVEYLWLAVQAYRFFQAVHTERGIHGVTNAPG